MSGAPPRPDNTLPGDLPKKPKTVLEYLEILYPKYFDPNDPSFVPGDILEIFEELAYEARPQCLRETLQNIAQAYYLAYLLEQREQQKPIDDGGGGTVTGDVILSEREGDVAITYADPLRTVTPGADTPPKTSWDKWNNLYQLCKYGAITTRVGRPVGG